MPKFNKTQINYVLSRVRESMVSRYGLYDELLEKYSPKKPAAVVKYQQELRAAQGKASTEADNAVKKQKEYLAEVEDSLMLGDVDFNLEEVLKKMKELV